MSTAFPPPAGHPLTRLAAALALGAAFAAPAAPARASQSMVCVDHNAGYVARVILQRRGDGGSWEEISRRTMTAGDGFCHRWGDPQARRISVEGHTGVGWRRTCEAVFESGRSGTVAIAGTSLHQRCDIW